MTHNVCSHQFLYLPIVVMTVKEKRTAEGKFHLLAGSRTVVPFGESKISEDRTLCRIRASSYFDIRAFSLASTIRLRFSVLLSMGNLWTYLRKWTVSFFRWIAAVFLARASTSDSSWEKIAAPIRAYAITAATRRKWGKTA